MYEPKVFVMSYKSYLFVLSQLSSRKNAECVIQGSVIFVEVEDKNQQWHLYTKVLDASEEKVPSFLRRSLGKKGILRWQERGAYLRLDPETSHVYLMQDIDSLSKYVPFKHVMNDFANVASEWKNILQEVSLRDDAMHRIG
jgi:hypothetical protein